MAVRRCSTGPALLNDARYRTSVIAVKDSFYVVPIGVEDECGVVPGVIVRSQPGLSVVDPSRLDGWLGFGFDYIGGTNESAIHWDIVKDLRSGGRIELDGKVVQENGVRVA